MQMAISVVTILIIEAEENSKFQREKNDIQMLH